MRYFVRYTASTTFHYPSLARIKDEGAPQLSTLGGPLQICQSCRNCQRCRNCHLNISSTSHGPLIPDRPFERSANPFIHHLLPVNGSVCRTCHQQTSHRPLKPRLSNDPPTAIALPASSLWEHLLSPRVAPPRGETRALVSPRPPLPGLPSSLEDFSVALLRRTHTETD